MRIAIRALRAVPQIDFSRAADASGATPAALRRAVASLGTRGRCAQQAVEAVASATSLTTAHAALHQPQCPPPPRRSVVNLGLIEGGLPGSSGWRSRGEDCDNAATPVLRSRAGPNESAWTRSTVGEHRDTPEAVLLRLAADTDTVVGVVTAVAHRRDLAHRRDFSPAVIGLFAGHPDAYCRQRAASHRRCPPPLLAVLCRDSDAWVRARAVRNERCPVAEIARLAGDAGEDTEVYEAAAKAAKRWLEMVDAAGISQEDLQALAGARHRANERSRLRDLVAWGQDE